MKLRVLNLLLALAGTAAFSLARAQSDINLNGYTVTFDDEFTSLSATTTSPKGTKTWYAQPLNAAGYYSESTWDISALSVSGGILSDKAFLDNSNNWHSGELLSVDPTTAGFSQKYGYFEIRCQMPNSGAGAWPAFWLDTTGGITGGQNEEVDIFEWYGVCDTAGAYQDLVQQTSHNWNADGSQNQTTAPYLPSTSTAIPDGTYPWQGYHIYGVQIDPEYMTWYIDGVKTNRCATPTSYLSTPFFVQLDYALGGGWSLSGMVNNSTFNVDWVRVYSLPTFPLIYNDAASATQGTAFSYQISAQNSPTSYNASGLPSGLTVNTASGLISGTPTASGIFNVTVSATNANGTGTATLVLTVSSGRGIGLQFQGTGTAMATTDSAGILATAQTHWNALTGSSFTNQALSDNAGTGTAAKLSGNAAGTYTGGGSTALPAGNAKLASGELFDGSTAGSNAVTVSSIPYGFYDVYVYAGIDTSGRNETVSLTPSGGSAQYYSFTTEGGGSAWTAATSTWNGSGTAPTLPTANYVHFAGLTASSFSLTFFAPGNGGMNGVQIVPTPPTITSSATAAVTAGSAFNYNITATTNPTGYNATGLPSGLTINKGTGAITGTATVPGTYAVTITATSATGSTSKTLTLNVTAQANTSDTPVMPPWGMALLALLLVMAAGRFLPRLSGMSGPS